MRFILTFNPSIVFIFHLVELYNIQFPYELFFGRFQKCSLFNHMFCDMVKYIGQK